MSAISSAVIEVAHHDRDRRPGSAGRGRRARRARAPLRRWRRAARRSLDDVGERQHERAHEAVGVGEVGEQIGGLASGCGRGSTLIVAVQRGASPENMLPRLVPSAASRPAPLERRRSISAASRRVVGDHRAPRLLLVPAERGHVPVAAQQQPGLAGARSGEERSHSQPITRWLPSASQRAIVGTCPSRDRLAQHALAEAVDLEHDHPGHVGAVRRARVPRRAAGRRAGDAHRRRRRAAARRTSTRAPAPKAIAEVVAERAASCRRRRRTRAPPSPALSTSEPRPKVMIVSGSARRVSERPQNRVDHRHRRRRRAAPPANESVRTPGSSAVEHDQHERLDRQQDRRARIEEADRDRASGPERGGATAARSLRHRLLASGPWPMARLRPVARARPGTVSFSWATPPS